MAFVFRGDRVDEETNMRATQRLYTLLPDHKCPQRDCPFHPPPEEETKEEDELPTEIVIKPQKSSAGVEEGGRLMAPPPPQPDEGYLPEMTIDLGEEMVLSDHDSVITGDSGVGREREDFSDGETGVFRPHSPSPSPPPLPLLQHIEEDEEVMTLTPESSTLGDSEVEQDSGDERDTPRTLTPLPEVEKEPQIWRDARDREMPGYTPLRLPVPEPTPPADFKLQAAPEFTAKLKNKRVPEGLSLHLHCSVTGLPEPRVRWLKDGLEIKAGSGFTIKNNYGLLTLEVLTAGRHHGGVYGCQAYNQHGTVACDATVTIEGEEVVNTIQVEILRPRFLIPLHDLVVTEGEDVIMYCIATGKPLPALKWQKDMLEVTTTSRVTVTTDGEGGSVLAIRKVKASDAGLYLVQAKSRSGRCKSTATLRVRAGTGRRASLPSLLHPHNAFCLATSLTPKVKHDIPPSISLLLPPTLDVHEGDSLRLDCSVQGYPTPIVSWYKNHRGLRYGPRHRVLFVGSLHTLHIPQTMALDSGDYIVRAHNNWGSAESVCFVRLLPPRTSTDDISPAQPSLASPQPIKMGEEPDEKLEAPFFTKALPSTVEVSEGGNFRLDCVTREGIQMVNWSQDTDTGQQPAASGPHDTGQPASQAASGSDSDTQNVRTSKESTGEELQQGSKQFQQHLPEEVGVRVGESVTLTCTVSQPFTRIRWYKDDDRLSFDSARLESLREEGGRVLLRVDDTRQSDAGQYRCVATLPDGTQLQSHTRLSVLEQDEIQQKIDTRQTTPPAEMTSSVNTEKTPVLLLDHQRHVVGQGQKAKFKVTVEGSSPCTVTWSREGEPLKAGAKFKMYEEEGGHCLEVSEVSGEDRGTYHVTVTTQDGAKVTTSALLDIGEKEANDNNTKEPSSSTSSSTSTSPSPSQPPTLQSPLQDMDVVIGDRDVKLQCRVDVSEGSANSRVRWHHEGREVGEGEAGYRRGWSGRVASLTLGQVTPQQAGQYRCVISSADGEVTTSCTLYVREPEKLEPPYFIKELRDLEVLDGDKVELIVEVEGQPAVQVYWHHNNVPVTARTPGVRLLADRHVHSLVIAQATAKHGGEYVCEAYNSCGDTDSFCRLHVKEHADPDPPALLAPPLSLTVPEGATSALFTCQVKGHPPPAVTWTREGTLLLTDHHYTVTSKGDTHSLEIVTPQKSDEGEYESHVHNIAGTVTGRCSLTVTEATAAESSSCADSRNINSSQDVESSKRTGQSEHDKKGQHPDSLLDRAIPTSPSLSPTTDPSVSSTTPTTTTTTSPTTQQSRGRSVGVLGRSLTWHSTVATPIRVGSVRKRRDWFEERASPSPPDRAPMGLRRSASSVVRHGQTAPGDRASPGTPDRHRQTPLHDSVSPLDTDSRNVLAPAIYQTKTVPSSTEHADKTKRQLLTSVTSQPGSAGERGSESYSPHTRESQTAGSFIAEFSGSRKQESHKHVSKPLSPETERNRTVQRKVDSELLRPQSPGRMDFRSVLKPRQTESGGQQGGNTTEHQRTDFRSALKKATEKNSVVRRLFPDNGTQTADRQPLGGAGQSADRAKTDNVPRWRQHLSDTGQSVVGLLSEDSQTDDITLSPPDAARAMPENTTVLDTAEKRASFTTESETKQVVTSAPYTGTTTQPAAGTVSETPTEATSPSHLTCAAKSDYILQSSEQRYVTSAQMTIKLAAPDYNSRGQGGGGGGVSGEGCRKAEGEGVERQAPRLENQQECGGGQVVTRGAVSDHPQPQDSRTHKVRKMQVVSPPVSSPVGERSGTGDSGRGQQQQQQQPLSDPVRSDVTAPPVTDDVTSINAPDPELSSHCRQCDVVFVPGRKFEDFYDCGREVGRGKFGSVFECRAKQTGVTVAAKVLKVRGQGRKEDVRREVEVMNTLSSHPSLLLLHDAFMADRTMVLVTEFVGGGELLERVCGEQYELTERDCVHFLRQLCEGVAFMHSRGVLHLDLKPNNVLCLHPQSTRIKIIDFGLARFYKAGDSLHVLFGTPEFVAPEVISYDDISFATDMWSVGVVAYILLSGLSPFFGDTDAETLANVTQGDYDFDDDSFDVISDEAKDFISSLLLKRKEKRLSAEQCQRHAWLSRQRDSLKTRRLNTENLRSFLAAHRKRWHKTAQAIMAVQRMSSLSKIMPAHSKTTNGAHSEETAHS